MQWLESRITAQSGQDIENTVNRVPLVTQQDISGKGKYHVFQNITRPITYGFKSITSRPTSY